MKTKIFAHLKTKLAGVPDAYIQGVADQYSKTITDEAQIATVINDGTIEVLRTSALYAQQEGDRRAQGAQKTALDDFRKKHNLDENGKPIQNPNPQPNPTPGVGGEEMPAWAKGLLETVTKLSGTVEQVNVTKAREAKMAQVRDKLKAKGVEEKHMDLFADRVNVDSESLDAEIESVATKYTAFKQDIINQEVASGGYAPSAGSVTEDSMVAQLNAYGSQFEKK
jgi:hypothetical protein